MSEKSESDQLQNDHAVRFQYDWSHTFKDTVIGPDGMETNVLIILPCMVCYFVPGMWDLLLVLAWLVADITIRKYGYTVQAFLHRLKVKLTVSGIMGGHNRIKVRRLLKAKKIRMLQLASAE